MKIGGPTFFKFIQMQTISILPGFVHPCPFLAFLCFVRVLLMFWVVILLFQLFLWSFDQCWNCLKLRDLAPLRRLERVFRCYIVCETKEDCKKGCLMVWANYMSPCNSIVELYFRVLVTSYQLPWQRTRSTKAASKFRFL